MNAAQDDAEPGFAAQLREDLADEDMRHVLVVFAADLERLTDEIADAAQRGDGTRLRRQAHALAGAAGAVGADSLDRVCRRAMIDPALDADSMQRHLAEIRAAAALTGRALARLHAEFAERDPERDLGPDLRRG